MQKIINIKPILFFFKRSMRKKKIISRWKFRNKLYTLCLSLSFDKFGALPIVISAILCESAVLTYKCVREHSRCLSLSVVSSAGRLLEEFAFAFAVYYRGVWSAEPRWNHDALSYLPSVFASSGEIEAILWGNVHETCSQFFFFFLRHLHVLQSHVSFLVIVLFLYILYIKRRALRYNQI